MARRLEDETAKEKLEAAERKSLMDTLTNWNFGVEHYRLNRGETTTTGGCLTISGATPTLSFLSAPGRFCCLF